MTASPSFIKKSRHDFLSQQLYFMETSSPVYSDLSKRLEDLVGNREISTRARYPTKASKAPTKNSEGNWKIWKIAKQRRMTKETSNTTRVTTFRVPLMLFGAAKR